MMTTDCTAEESPLPHSELVLHPKGGFFLEAAFFALIKRKCEDNDVIIDTMKIISVSTNSGVVERFLQAQNQSAQFPEQLDLNNLKKIEQYSHASSAPWKVQDKTTGAFYILKQERSSTPGHLSNESDLENYARSVGMKVPPSHTYKTPEGTFKLSQFVEGTLLNKLSGPALQEAVKRTKNDFLTHALLGNADMYGMFRDNVLVDKSGTPWFIDLGGGGPFRAMGQKKTPDRWNDQASEVDSMRKGPYANQELTDLSDDELRNQFANISKGHQNALNSFQDPQTMDMIHRRFETLKKRFGQPAVPQAMARNIAALIKIANPVMAPDPAPQVGSSPLSGRLDKYLQNQHRWLLSDLTPEEQKQQYAMHAQSYQSAGHDAYPFNKYQQYATQGRTPWTFLGDKERTGYVTIKKVPDAPVEIYKMTATAGDKKGKLSGMAQILKSDKPIFGAVTEDLYQMCIKIGFHPLAPDEVRSLVQLGLIGGDVGKIDVGPNGELNIQHNVAGNVTKKMIGNGPFKQLVDQMNSMGGVSALMGMKGKGFGKGYGF